MYFPGTNGDLDWEFVSGMLMISDGLQCDQSIRTYSILSISSTPGRFPWERYHTGGDIVPSQVSLRSRFLRDGYPCIHWSSTNWHPPQVAKTPYPTRGYVIYACMMHRQNSIEFMYRLACLISNISDADCGVACDVSRSRQSWPIFWS